MKKIYFLLVALIAYSITQAQPLSLTWKKAANSVDYTWFTGTGNDVNSIDYNPVTDKLLVARRGVGIFIINPATGAEEGQLSTTGVGGESFKYSKIRVTSDGVIYAISLQTAAGQCIINRWANQAANPTVAADFAVTERTGDAFGLSGSGNNTVLYASGAGLTAGNFNIYILNTVNGSNFFVESKVSMTPSPAAQQWSNRAVEPAGTGLTSDIWIKGGGFNARKISVGPNVAGVRTGTVVTTITDGVGNGEASVGYGGMRLLTTTTNNKFLTFSGGNNSNAGLRVKMLNVNVEATPSTYGLDSLGDQATYVTNANGTGDVAFKRMPDNTITVFFLSTNNGLGATRTTLSVLPISLTRFAANLNDKAVSVTWSTASEMNSAYFEVEKSMNGKEFSSIGRVATKAVNGNSNQPLDYGFTDTRSGSGKVYYRLKQYDVDGKFSISKVAMVNFPIEKGFNVTNIGNPVKNNINLVVNAVSQKTLQIQVSNANGVISFSKQYAVEAGNTSITIPTDNIAAGTFNVVVKEGTTQQVLRLIKL